MGGPAGPRSPGRRRLRSGPPTSPRSVRPALRDHVRATADDSALLSSIVSREPSAAEYTRSPRTPRSAMADRPVATSISTTLSRDLPALVGARPSTVSSVVPSGDQSSESRAIAASTRWSVVLSPVTASATRTSWVASGSVATNASRCPSGLHVSSRVATTTGSPRRAAAAVGAQTARGRHGGQVHHGGCRGADLWLLAGGEDGQSELGPVRRGCDRTDVRRFEHEGLLPGRRGRSPPPGPRTAWSPPRRVGRGRGPEADGGDRATRRWSRRRRRCRTRRSRGRWSPATRNRPAARRRCPRTVTTPPSPPAHRRQ